MVKIGYFRRVSPTNCATRTAYEVRRVGNYLGRFSSRDRCPLRRSRYRIRGNPLTPTGGWCQGIALGLMIEIGAYLLELRDACVGIREIRPGPKTGLGFVVDLDTPGLA